MGGAGGSGMRTAGSSAAWLNCLKQACIQLNQDPLYFIWALCMMNRPAAILAANGIHVKTLSGNI